jgi:hypothetical protein
MKATHVNNNNNERVCPLKITFWITARDIENAIYYLSIDEEKVTKKSIEKLINSWLYTQGANYEDVNSVLMNKEANIDKYREIAKKLYPSFYS